LNLRFLKPGSLVSLLFGDAESEGSEDLLVLCSPQPLTKLYFSFLV